MIGAQGEAVVNPKSISINFSGGRSGATYNAGADDGLVLGASWINLSGENGNNISLGDTGATISYSCQNTWDVAPHPREYTGILQGYLDDGGVGASVTVSSIPFTSYTVYIYCSTDAKTEGNPEVKFSPMNVNDKQYRWDGTTTIEVSPKLEGIDGLNEAKWGNTNAKTPVLGENVLKVENVRGPVLTVSGGPRDADNGAPWKSRSRASLAAVQIVNTGDVIDPAASLPVSGSINLSDLYLWSNSTESIQVSGSTTINMDTSKTLTRMKFVKAPNAADASLTFSGTGSLWQAGANVDVTLDSVPVTFCNNTHNTRVKLSGTGNATFANGTALVMPMIGENGYTGQLTLNKQEFGTEGNAPAWNIGSNGATLNLRGLHTTTIDKPMTGQGPLHMINAASREAGSDVEISTDLVKEWGDSHYDGDLTVDEKIHLRWGDTSNPGNHGAPKDTSYKLAKSVTLKQGSVLHLALTAVGGNSSNSDGKCVFASPINLRGGEINSNDGAYYFSGGISVEGDGSKLVTGWDKGIVIGSLSGSGNLQWKRHSGDGLARFSIMNAAAIPYTGMLTISKSAGDVRFYVFDTNAIKDATLNLQNGVSFSLTQPVSLKSITGNGCVTSDTSEAQTLALSGTSDLTTLTWNNVKIELLTGAVVTMNLGEEGTTEAPRNVPAGATLKLKIPGTGINQHQTAHVTGEGDVVFVNSTGMPLDNASTEKGVYVPSLNKMTISSATANWGDVGAWSKGAVPDAEDDVVIEVATDNATLRFDTNVTVASLKIIGTGTLAIDATHNLTVSTLLDVGANVSIDKEKVVLGSICVAENKTLTLNTETTIPDENYDKLTPTGSGNLTQLCLPSLTGTGKIIKTGAGAIAVFGEAIEPSIEVQSGLFAFRASNNNPWNVTVKTGTTVSFAGWNSNVVNNNNRLAVEGGASVMLLNGIDTKNWRNVKASVTVLNAPKENPVKFYGAAFGKVKLQGSITGATQNQSTIEFADGGRFKNNACDRLLNVEATLTDKIQVIVSESTISGYSWPIEFSGNNTYTGGTEITAEGKIVVSQLNKFGSGRIQNNGLIEVYAGDVQVKENTNPTAMIIEGAGLLKFTGTASGYYCPAHASRFECQVENNHSGGIVIPTTAGLTVGTLSGNGVFRGDWSDNGERTLTIVQSKDSTFSGTVGTDDSNTDRMVSLNVTGNGVLTASATKAKSGHKITVAKGATVKLSRSWKKLASNHASGDVVANGTLIIDGSVEMDSLSLVSEAILDTSAGALTANTVTLPVDGTVTVKANVDAAVLTVTDESSRAAANGTIVACDPAAEGKKFCLSAEGSNLKMKEVVAAMLPKPQGAQETDAYSEAASKALIDAIGGKLPTSITGVTGCDAVSKQPKVLTVADINNVLNLFTNVAQANGDAVNVSYEFGVKGLRIRTVDNLDYIIVAARVEGGTVNAPAAFGDGTTVKVVVGGTVHDAVECDAEGNEITAQHPAPAVEQDATGTTKYFRILKSDVLGADTVAPEAPVAGEGPLAPPASKTTTITVKAVKRSPEPASAQ